MREGLLMLVVVGCAGVRTIPQEPAELGYRTSAPVRLEQLPAPRGDVREQPNNDGVVDAVIAALTAHQLDTAAGLFDPSSGVTPAKVTAVWGARTAKLGKVTGAKIIDRSQQDGFDTRTVMFDFERGQLHCLISLAPDTALIASMFFSRPAPPAAYITASRFVDHPVTVGVAPYLLDGTLTLPTGPGPFAAVVLVHGSGPNDRDETVGANKMFKDIAEGLASSGIAVLRYDKRTFRYGVQLTNAITLNEEVIDDAVAAVRTLAARPEIDPSRLVVAGHSLGGLLAPEIAVRAGIVARVVLLAPPGRAPWDIVLSQMRYLGAPRETLRAVERAITIINLGLGAGTELLGVPYAYWQDWASRDGIAMARTFARPILVLHGDRDYQVLADDFAVWKRGLTGRKAVSLVKLAGDNHLFMKGTGPPGPAEYKVPSHVDERVIALVVAFVRAGRNER